MAMITKNDAGYIHTNCNLLP